MAANIRKTLPSSYLDEIGFKYGITRLKNESYTFYRRRLLDHIRNIPSPSEESYLKTINSVVGQEARNLLEIKPKSIWDPVLQEYKLVADNPYIEIDSCFMRIWSDYKNLDPELELNIVDREGAYFLGSVFEELNKIDFLDIKYLLNPEDWKWKKSSHLAYGNTMGVHTGHELTASRLNMLNHNYITEVTFEDSFTYINELKNQSGAFIKKPGEFHIDYISGLIYSYQPPTSSCTYSYKKFPFNLTWQPVRAYPFNDKSVDFIIKDNLINENGIQERMLLNSHGAKMINEILAIHPLQWGK